MKLDRNTNKDRKGKYALIKLRVPDAIRGAIPHSPNFPPGVFVRYDALDYGDTEDTEFFVIRLKDAYAAPALAAYAMAANIPMTLNTVYRF